MTPIITIRPAPGDAATVERGAHQGLTVTGHPLFSIAPLPWAVPDPDEFDAILLGSANSLRHGGGGLRALAALPALCVGATTARAARDAGFPVIAVGARGMQTLLPHAEARGLSRLLRLSGEAHVPLEPPPGISIETRIVYTVCPVPIDPSLARTLARGAIVLLHSGKAASHFAKECDRLGISRNAIALACLAPRIAEKAGDGWAARQHAASPDDAALLALAEQMCQSGLPGKV